jgi:cold-inducible RNA-binding protein
MASQTEGQKAIEGLNTHELKGKKIVVNEARPRRDSRGGRSGGGGRDRGRSGGGQRRY